MRKLHDDLGALADVLFIQEPETLALSRWNGRARRYYPEGLNPSLNVYRRVVVFEIADRIGLKDKCEVRQLRILLAFAAENVFRRFQSFGGPATNRQKSDWLQKVKREVKILERLLATEGGKAFPRSGAESDYKSERPLPNPIYDSGIYLSEELADFYHVLSKAVIGNIPDGYDSAHAFYLQYMVNCLSYTFARFFGLAEIKRVTSGSMTYGKFPIFVRLAMPPMIQAYYPSLKEREQWSSVYDSTDRSYDRYGKDPAAMFDRQIQKAVVTVQEKI